MVDYKDIQHLNYNSLIKRALKSGDNMKELKVRLEAKPYRAVETGIPPKVMADWNRHDLLLVKPEKNKMHRFSITEFVWVKLIEKMRQQGLPLKVIKEFKDSLHDDFFEQEAEPVSKSFLKEQLSAMPWVDSAILNRFLKEKSINDMLTEHLPEGVLDGNVLELLVLLCLYLKTPISFFLYHSGEAIVFNSLMLQDGMYRQEDIEKLFSSSFVSISLTEVLSEVLLLSDVDILHGQLKVLSDMEANVLDALREDEVSSVVIRFDKDSQMDLMEVKKVQKAEREVRLMDLMLKDGYEEITVKTQHGKIVRCENTRKVKLK
ncbi:MAG TPA: hypothetical protein DCR04_06855 [Flavobacteriales bacterium]|nr:hypothetical protein [Flavobacteriales bacterium]